MPVTTMAVLIVDIRPHSISTIESSIKRPQSKKQMIRLERMMESKKYECKLNNKFVFCGLRTLDRVN